MNGAKRQPRQSTPSLEKMLSAFRDKKNNCMAIDLIQGAQYCGVSLNDHPKFTCPYQTKDVSPKRMGCSYTITKPYNV